MLDLAAINALVLCTGRLQVLKYQYNASVVFLQRRPTIGAYFNGYILIKFDINDVLGLNG